MKHHSAFQKKKTAIWDNMDKPRKHYAKQINLDTGSWMLPNHTGEVFKKPHSKRGGLLLGRYDAGLKVLAFSYLWALEIYWSVRVSGVLLYTLWGDQTVFSSQRERKRSCAHGYASLAEVIIL